MPIFMPLGALLALLLISAAPVTQASSGFSACTAPCDIDFQSKLMPGYKRQSATPGQADSKALGGETLSGELAGDWDAVTANITFPYDNPVSVDLQFVALRLPATAQGNDQYSAPGWNRELFFLDIGDGIPRLLSAYLLDAQHTPDPQDVIFETGQLWGVQYVQYQEFEELERNPNFYDSYPDGASNADLRFVTDDAGEVLQLAVDIYDEFDEYQYSVEPQNGDRFNPGIVGYDVNDPDIVYILAYFEDLVALSDEVSLERRYYVPSGAVDPALPEDFDSATLPLNLVLEGERGAGETLAFGYSPARSLGYDWGEAKTASPPPPRSGGSGALGLITAPLCALLLGMRRGSRRSRRV